MNYTGRSIAILEKFVELFGVPTFGIPTILYEVWFDHRSVTLVNKVNAYLRGTSLMTPAQIESFQRKVNNNENFKSDVISVLIDIIDKIYVDRNIDVLANLSNALARDLIDSDDFFRAGGILRNILYSDLMDLQNYLNTGHTGGYRSNSSFYLQSVGLIRMSTFGGGEILFQLTELGEIVLEFGLNNDFIGN